MARAGKWHIEDFGAVPINWGEDIDQPNPSLRSANTAAIQSAFAAALSTPNGGTLEVGSGIYLTNGFSGINVARDMNVNIILQGVSSASMIMSNNYTAPTLGFHTSAGNLRGFVVRDLILRGGREGLSLRQCAYNHVERVWFWGSRDVGLLNEMGSTNEFVGCRFDEGAQGISTGSEADALVFTSCEDTLRDCTFGEYSGGLIFNRGSNALDNCAFRDTFTRRAKWHSYVTGADLDQAANLLPMRAAIINWGSSLSITSPHGKAAHRFVSAFRAYELLINGARMFADLDFPFTGFVNVVTGGGTPLALKISGSQFIWPPGKSGYFVADPDSALHDAMVEAQLTAYPGSTITPLGTSAPSLLNPSGQNNLVTTRTFERT